MSCAEGRDALGFFGGGSALGAGAGGATLRLARAGSSSPTTAATLEAAMPSTRDVLRTAAARVGVHPRSSLNVERTIVAEADRLMGSTLPIPQR